MGRVFFFDLCGDLKVVGYCSILCSCWFLGIDWKGGYLWVWISCL